MFPFSGYTAPGTLPACAEGAAPPEEEPRRRRTVVTTTSRSCHRDLPVRWSASPYFTTSGTQSAIFVGSSGFFLMSNFVPLTYRAGVPAWSPSLLMSSW